MPATQSSGGGSEALGVEGPSSVPMDQCSDSFLLLDILPVKGRSKTVLVAVQPPVAYPAAARSRMASACHSPGVGSEPGHGAA